VETSLTSNFFNFIYHVTHFPSGSHQERPTMATTLTIQGVSIKSLALNITLNFSMVKVKVGKIGLS
jgi:hypothetical protein